MSARNAPVAIVRPQRLLEEESKAGVSTSKDNSSNKKSSAQSNKTASLDSVKRKLPLKAGPASADSNSTSTDKDLKDRISLYDFSEEDDGDSGPLQSGVVKKKSELPSPPSSRFSSAGKSKKPAPASGQREGHSQGFPEKQSKKPVADTARPTNLSLEPVNGDEHKEDDKTRASKETDNKCGTNSNINGRDDSKMDLVERFSPAHERIPTTSKMSHEQLRALDCESVDSGVSLGNR